MPRGRTARRASSRPSGLPVHSTTRSAARGSSSSPVRACAMPRAGEQRELARAAAHDEQLAAGHGQRLRDEVAELAVADHDDAVARARRATCSCISSAAASGSVKTAASSGSAVGHRVQVRDRQRQVLGEGAVAADDAEHGALLAVRAPSRPAGRARAAGRVDLADDAPADPLGRAGAAARRAPTNSWPGTPRERVVAAHELEVGVADPREAHAHERLARGRRGSAGCRRAGAAPAPRARGRASNASVRARPRAFLRAASNSSPGLPAGARGAFATFRPR